MATRDFMIYIYAVASCVAMLNGLATWCIMKYVVSHKVLITCLSMLSYNAYCVYSSCLTTLALTARAFVWAAI